MPRSPDRYIRASTTPSTLSDRRRSYFTASHNNPLHRARFAPKALRSPLHSFALTAKTHHIVIMATTLFDFPQAPPNNAGPLEVTVYAFKLFAWLGGLFCSAIYRISTEGSQEVRPSTTPEQAQAFALLVLGGILFFAGPMLRRIIYPATGSLIFVGILYYMIRKQLRASEEPSAKYSSRTTPPAPLPARNTNTGGFLSSFRANPIPPPPPPRNSNSSTSLNSMLSSRSGSTFVDSDDALEVAKARLRTIFGKDQTGTPSLSSSKYANSSSHSIGSVLRTPIGSPIFNSPPPSSPKTPSSSNSSKSTLGVRFDTRPAAGNVLTKKPASTKSSTSTSTFKALLKAPLYTTPAPKDSWTNSTTARSSLKTTLAELAKAPLCAPDPAKAAKAASKPVPSHKGECVCNVCVSRREVRAQYMRDWHAKEDERKKAIRHQLEITWGLGGQQQAW